MTSILTGEAYQSFLNYFSKNFKEVRAKFPEVIDWSLLTPPYCTRKPVDMSDDDFDQFRLIEFEWLIKNNYIPETSSAKVFIMPKNGIVSVNPADVIEIAKISDNITAIKTIEQGNEPIYNVVGNVSFVTEKINLNREDM